MSELMNTRDNRAIIRRKLLTSASALALTAYVSSVNVAKAEDADRPLLWIELGGQMENVSGQGEVFAPGFIAANPNSPVLNPTTPLQAQRPPSFSFSEEGKITFQPEDSDWLFSAAIRYGRPSNFRHVDHQTNRLEKQYGFTGKLSYRSVEDFADTQAHHRDRQTILDFSVGKDVGLGLFGRESSSVVSAGVRIAQFTSDASVDIRARPDLRVVYFTNHYIPLAKIPGKYYHAFHATGHASRSFRGVGPSLSWNGSTPFVGNQRDGELMLDWGVNGAILFGRQRTHVRHQEIAHYSNWKYGRFGGASPYQLVYQRSGEGHDTVRSVTVPNVGGFAGLSWRVQNFKASFGYRADFFFGAIDGGIDTRKNETLGFTGPFASVSVGLGD